MRKLKNTTYYRMMSTSVTGNMEGAQLNFPFWHVHTMKTEIGNYLPYGANSEKNSWLN